MAQQYTTRRVRFTVSLGAVERIQSNITALRKAIPASPADHNSLMGTLSILEGIRDSAKRIGEPAEVMIEGADELRIKELERELSSAREEADAWERTARRLAAEAGYNPDYLNPDREEG